MSSHWPGVSQARPVPPPEIAAKERRERIATAVMAGFAWMRSEDVPAFEAADHAVLWADALIAMLDKGGK